MLVPGIRNAESIQRASSSRSGPIASGLRGRGVVLKICLVMIPQLYPNLWKCQVHRQRHAGDHEEKSRPAAPGSSRPNRFQERTTDEGGPWNSTAKQPARNDGDRARGDAVRREVLDAELAGDIDKQHRFA